MNTEATPGAPEEDGKRGGAKRSARLDGAEILVVEDEQLTLRSLERTLRGEGARVRCARTVDDARQMLGEAEYDAAVVDLWLNGASAREVLQRLCGGPRPTSVLVITGQSGREAAEQTFAAGATDFLLKPFEADTFIEAVQRAIQRTRRDRPSEGEDPARSAPGAGDGGGGATEPARDLAASPAVRTGGAGAARRGAAVPARSLSAMRRMIGWRGPPKTLGLLDLEVVLNDLCALGELSTGREREVLRQLLIGRRTDEIAADLEVTERAVKFHVSNILAKLSLTSRAELPSLFFKR